MGRLGVADISTAQTDTVVYTVPAGKRTSFTIFLCNRTSGTIMVRVAIATSNTPTASEYIEFGSLIPANGGMERTGFICSAGERVVIWTSEPGISVRINGMEEDAI